MKQESEVRPIVITREGIARLQECATLINSTFQVSWPLTVFYHIVVVKGHWNFMACMKQSCCSTSRRIQKVNQYRLPIAFQGTFSNFICSNNYNNNSITIKPTLQKRQSTEFVSYALQSTHDYIQQILQNATYRKKETSTKSFLGYLWLH